ncbi:MAG: hypothetical protein ABIF85_00570 [Nanoarchaeota archaeon]|nr:hypothetical protein [Nanoarchaeota archaeon]MBU4451811.1 hypothetical protein [Nanoarchaeota archaeon]MCG2723460.1 hypothetical protein [archaeon]
MADINKIYSDRIFEIEKNTKQKRLEEFIPKSASPTEECYLFGCNTYGCLSSGRCEE